MGNFKHNTNFEHINSLKEKIENEKELVPLIEE